MTENVEELVQEIKTDGTERISDLLREIVAEGAVLEEVDRAKELLEKLSEYKPLAKVEEMDKPQARVSLKERLAEKKAIIAGNDKAADTQENTKKNQREM